MKWSQTFIVAVNPSLLQHSACVETPSLVSQPLQQFVAHWLLGVFHGSSTAVLTLTSKGLMENAIQIKKTTYAVSGNSITSQVDGMKSLLSSADITQVTGKNDAFMSSIEFGKKKQPRKTE